jgi:2-oxoisovalerate dehydrogenase E1 component
MNIDAQERRALYGSLIMPRVIEERMLILLRQGVLSKWFSGIGQEAVSVGATWALKDDDYILPMHRNLGVFTTRKMDFDRLFLQLLGREGGFTDGRDRSFHFGDLKSHIVGMISHLGAMLPVACGLGLAAQLSGSQQVALAFTGDGATSEGDVHEAMNLAAVWKLPVIFLVENNQYGLSTPTAQQYACDALADRAVGYGMPGERIDGNDVLAVLSTVSAAVERARAGQGPTLIECMTFRMRGHEEASGTAYVPDSLMAKWGAKDPIERFETQLQLAGDFSAQELTKLKADLALEIRDRMDGLMRSAEPCSSIAQETAAVYARPLAIPEAIIHEHTEMRYIDAIKAALHEQMHVEPKTVLMGQDIAEYGGAFKITDGFLEQFGKERVRNTPIVESSVIGCALGLALAGFKPMVEMQFADFISCGFNQIVNNLAKTHYRWGAAVPVVIRAPFGGGMGAGPFHSQCIESWFTSVAGLRVVAPATPADAKGLLKSAFADQNPVIFLEHKKLYRSCSGPVPKGNYAIPLGKASIARAGCDLSIVTYSLGVHWALAAAEKFAELGYEIEVVDLRTLLPWDQETVFQSVRGTSRALVLHEASLTGGFGAEVAASIGSACFEWLDAPVRRVASLDTPIPFGAQLEKQYLAIHRLDEEIHALLQY